MNGEEYYGWAVSIAVALGLQVPIERRDCLSQVRSYGVVVAEALSLAVTGKIIASKTMRRSGETLGKEPVCPEDYVVKFAQDEQKKISVIPAVFVHKPLLNRVLD